MGWNGGYCGYCDKCRRGNFFACQTSTQVTGVTRDGGYADYMLAPFSALATVPQELSAVEAAPLMCAGLTTYNCLRNSGARPGDVVAVIGLGGRAIWLFSSPPKAATTPLHRPWKRQGSARSQTGRIALYR